MLENENIFVILWENICYLSEKPTLFGSHVFMKNFHLMSMELWCVSIKVVSAIFLVCRVTVKSIYLYLVDYTEPEPAYRQLSTCEKPNIPRDCHKSLRHPNRKEGMYCIPTDSIISPLYCLKTERLQQNSVISLVWHKGWTGLEARVLGNWYQPCIHKQMTSLVWELRNTNGHY